MARAALAAVQRVAGDPEARAGLRALALIFQFLLRCQQATDVAAPANPRRSGWRIFAEQRRMANCEVVSAAATGALPTRRGHEPLAPMTANPVKGWMELNQRFQMRLWNAVSAFANCGLAVANVRGSYGPEAAVTVRLSLWLLS
jgi:hypothetical protein